MVLLHFKVYLPLSHNPFAELRKLGRVVSLPLVGSGGLQKIWALTQGKKRES